MTPEYEFSTVIVIREAIVIGPDQSAVNRNYYE